MAVLLQLQFVFVLRTFAAALTAVAIQQLFLVIRRGFKSGDVGLGGFEPPSNLYYTIATFYLDNKAYPFLWPFTAGLNIGLLVISILATKSWILLCR